jgi:hypothetical protein
MSGRAELLKQPHDEPVIRKQIAFENGLVMEDAVAEIQNTAGLQIKLAIQIRGEFNSFL